MIVYIKTADEAEFLQAMTDADWVNEDSEIIKYSATHSLDIIGRFSVANGTTTDSDGFEIPVMEEVEGYHANLLLHNGGTIPESIKPYIIDAPSTPHRKFA